MDIEESGRPFVPRNVLPGVPKTSHTRIKAEFYSHDNDFSGTIYDAEHTTGREPFSIVTWQSHKAFGGASGAWSLGVKARAGQDLCRLWRDPESVWVVFSVHVRGKLWKTLVGLIDNVSESMHRADNGSRDVNYTITGRDFGKVFEHTELFVNRFEKNALIPFVAVYDGMNTRSFGTPSQVVDSLLNAWLANRDTEAATQTLLGTLWKLPPGLPGRVRGSTTGPARAFFDVLRRKLGTTKGTANDPVLLEPDYYARRNLWAVLQEWSNGILNEMWVDLAPEGGTDASPWVPTFFLRERQFPTMLSGRAKWEALDTYTLTLGDVRDRSVSLGSPESRFNYWMLDISGRSGVGIDTDNIAQEYGLRDKGSPGGIPIYNVDSIERHGLRRWTGATNYIPAQDNPTFMGQIPYWLLQLHDWYVASPWYYTGSITLNGIYPEIRIGMRVLEHRRRGPDIVYYVEGVTHDYQYPGHSTTTLTVTRGEFANEFVLDNYYATLRAAPDGAFETPYDALLTTPATPADAATSPPADIVGEAVQNANGAQGQTADERLDGQYVDDMVASLDRDVPPDWEPSDDVLTGLTQQHGDTASTLERGEPMPADQAPEQLTATQELSDSPLPTRLPPNTEGS